MRCGTVTVVSKLETTTKSARKTSSLFDATQTMVAKIDDDTYQVQVVSWYDNENSYTSQMVRTIKYFAENC